METEQEIPIRELDEILPVEPGFAFECTRCGNCCRELNNMLALDELSYFTGHGLNVAYTITIKKVDMKVISVYPCKPPGPCSALMDGLDGDTTLCLIYAHPPSVCKMFPFVMRIYYQRPPTLEEIDQSLRAEKEGRFNRKLRPYIYPLDNKRWAFFGYRKKPLEFCPGIGRGKTWDKYQIRRFVVERIYLFENSKELLNETNRVLLENLMLWDEQAVSKHFEPIMDLFEDEEVIVRIYRPLDVIIYDMISGNDTLKDPMPGNLKLKDPLK